MTKREWLRRLQTVYYIANNADHSEAHENWTNPSMAGKTCCQHIDRMMRDLEDDGVLTPQEVQEFYDTLGDHNV